MSLKVFLLSLKVVSLLTTNETDLASVVVSLILLLSQVGERTDQNTENDVEHVDVDQEEEADFEE